MIETLHFIDQAKQKECTLRELKVKNQARPKTLLLFVDLKRAFDSCDRSRFLHKLHENRFPSNLIDAYREILTNTQMFVQGKSIKTQIGFP